MYYLRTLIEQKIKDVKFILVDEGWGEPIAKLHSLVLDDGQELFIAADKNIPYIELPLAKSKMRSLYRKQR